MTKVAMVLAGSGVYDGTEIHEATLTYYFLDKAGAQVSFFAPDINQTDVINHLKGEPLTESRSVLVESARIARGNVAPLSDANPDEFDAVIFPGGFGAAKTLSNYAAKNTQCEVNEDVAQFIKAIHSAKKPLGFLCISPVIAAKLLPNVRLTVGLDQQTSDHLKEMGAIPVQANYDDVVVDEDHLIYSTPAYMLDASISQIAQGIEKLVKSVLSNVKTLAN